MSNETSISSETRIDKNGVTFRAVKLTQCPQCGGAGIHKLMDAEDFESQSGDYAVWQCHSCETFFCNPQVLADDIPLLYENRDTQDFNPTVDKNSLVFRLRTWHAKKQIKGLLSRTGNPKLFDVMDFGCGDGMFSLALAATPGCKRVNAVDFHSEAPDILQNSKVVYSSVADLGAGEKSKEFDIIICRHIVEHVANPQGFVTQMASYLKPGGYIFVEVPNYASIWRRIFGKYWSILYVPRHLYWFTERSVRKAFQEVDIVDVYRCETPTIGGSLRLKFGLPINNTDLIGIALYPIQSFLEKIFGSSSTLIVVARRPIQETSE